MFNLLNKPEGLQVNHPYILIGNFSTYKVYV